MDKPVEFSAANDALCAQNILSFLPQREIAGEAFLYDTIGSTSTVAKEMAGTGAGHGTVVIAEHQTAGRGRFGRSFHSPGQRGIYMSIILDPARLGLSEPTLATVFASVVVCEATEALCVKTPQIKWVNDVFLDSKKICGILTEATAQRIIVGIGINFSTAPEEFPEEIRESAGAIFPCGNPTISRNRLAGEVIGRLLAPAYGRAELLARYKQRLMVLGKDILVTGAGQPYRATALDIDDTGRLIVRKNTGEVICLSAGEISIR